MKLISFGNIDQKFLIYVLFYIIIILSLNFLSIILQDTDVSTKDNIPLILIIIHGSLILCIIMECWLRKTIANKKPKEEEKESNEKNSSNIIYIYNNPKKANINQFLILILMIVLDYIYDAGLMYYQKRYENKPELVFGEIYKFFDVLFLLAFFRLFHKIFFYKHQYISLSIIIIMGLGKFFGKVIYDKEFNKNIEKFDYLSFIFMFLFPFIDSVKIYFLQKYMIYNYYSPFYICLLIGFIYLFISSIIIIIIKYVGCSNDLFICKYLSFDSINIPGVGQIFLLIGYSMFYSLEHFMNLLTINSFTAFHLVLLVTFGELINSFFKFYVNYSTFDLINNLIAYFFEIIGVLVFIETIELNFCGLNRNLKKNIMFRAGNEVESIYKQEKESESEETVSVSSENLDTSEDNTMYN